MVLVDSIKPAIFRIHVGEQLTNDDVRTYVNVFDQNIQAGTSFGCLIQYQGGSPKKSKKGHKLENDWLEAHKGHMNEYCFGIALLANPGIRALLQKIILKGFGKNFFGCECDVFFDEESARNWLLSQQAGFVPTRSAGFSTRP